MRHTRPVVDALVHRLGLPAPHPNWTQNFPGFGYEAVFARIGDRASAPTRIEVIAPVESGRDAPGDAAPSYFDQIYELQDPRPLKAHSTVLAISDIDALVEHVERRGIDHRIDEPTAQLPHRRLWIGVTPDRPGGYLPDYDAGLMLEMIPTNGLLMPPQVHDNPPPEPPESLQPHELRRVVNRRFLVEDVDRSVKMLATNFSLEPSEAIEVLPQGRRARYQFSISHGSLLELWQPSDSAGTDQEFFNRFGQGAFDVHLTVSDLDAKIADLRERSTRHIDLAPDEAHGRRLLVDHDQTPGFRFQLLEEAEWAAMVG